MIDGLQKNTLVKTGGPTLNIGEGPLVMGILNVTPDSFSDGGRFFDTDKAVEHALTMVRHGADIIDIGGESTRPGAAVLGVSEELKRVIPVIERLRQKSDIFLSIDTRNSEVACRACAAGAMMINDVSGLQHDEKIIQAARDADAFLVLMHMRGTPPTMQSDIHYDNLIGDIAGFLADAAKKAIRGGVAEEKIIIDPGIGFGKTTEHNLSILKNIRQFKKIGFPVLIGASRKSFIGKSLNLPVDDRLEGSLAAAMYAVMQGADIVRVHDVLQTVRAFKMLETIDRAE